MNAGRCPYIEIIRSHDKLQEQTIYLLITDYFNAKNCTIAWQRALQDVCGKQEKGIHFPAGTYHFHQEGLY